MLAQKFSPPEEPDLTQEFKDYAYIVSHDLGAPARLMVEFARLLGERQNAFADEEDRLLLAEIIENGEKMRTMMQGLLSFSRLNTLAAHHIPVDMQKIAEHCHMLVQGRLKALNGRLSFATLPNLKADPDQLMQLFTLLVDNALKFHRPGVPPQIYVTAEREEDRWMFSVVDNGIGIETAYHKRVFKPFQKLHTDEAYPGVGMGLALARKIVALHGGHIWIDALPTVGTAVRFTLRAS